MVLLEFRNNMPWNKPELWRNFPRSLTRRMWMPKGETVASIAPGITMRLNLQEDISRSLYLYGSYNPVVQHAIMDAVGPDMTFVDVGANVGFYSLLASRVATQVYALEPVPSTCDLFETNMSLNNAANIALIRCAASDTIGPITIYVPQDSTGASVLPRIGRELTVPAVTVDHVLGEKQVDVIKIDVEGAEDAVIRGSADVIARCRPMVICEGPPDCPAAALLRSYAYSIVPLEHRTYEPENFVARPN